MAEQGDAPLEQGEVPLDDFAPPKRVLLTLETKIGLCINADRLVYAEKKVSLKQFCRSNDIQPSQLRRWHKNLMQMKNSLDRTRAKKARKTCVPGRKSRLDLIKDKILPWVDSLRSSGKTVTVRMVAIRAKRYDSSLRRMKRYTLFACVRRFCNAHGIVMRATTHTSQEDPRGKQDEATSFLMTTRPLLVQGNRDKRFIINMDQTPYNPKDVPSKTLNKRGQKTVASKTMKTSVDRVTCCLAVAADGTKLLPLIAYKAKSGGSVEREFAKNNYPVDIEYTVQENAWTDERVMLDWVDRVLRPYVEKTPHGVVPYLLLDKYKCHYQGSVAKAIEDLGVEWDIIPGGCTGLIQPIDVGIGKPFKNRMRYKWEEWLIDQYDDNNAVVERVKPVDARKYIAEWASQSWQRIPKEVVYNAWRHKPFSYFPDEATVPTNFQAEEDLYDDNDEDEGDEELEVEEITTI